MSILKVVTSIIDDKYRVEAELTEPADLPKDIFVYRNTGTEELGEFQGVCTLREYTTLQTFKGEALPVFGNGYLKYGKAVILVKLTDDVDRVIMMLKENVSTFGSIFRNSKTILKTYSV